MSDERKRVHWKRFADDPGQVRLDGRAGAMLNTRAWSLLWGTGPGAVDAAVRGLLTVLCISFFVFVLLSAKEGMWAWRSPLLTLIGCAACAIFKLVLIMVGMIMWVLTGDRVFLDYGSCEFPFGHPGLLRVVLAALTVAVSLFWGTMELMARYLRTGQARCILLRWMCVAETLLCAGILGVTLLRILPE